MKQIVEADLRLCPTTLGIEEGEIVKFSNFPGMGECHEWRVVKIKNTGAIVKVWLSRKVDSKTAESE